MTEEPNASGGSDAELLALTARKDAEAFARLYDLYSSRVYGLALRILRNEAQAEEILQEIFITLWEKAEQFDGVRGGALSWLMTMCRNRCIDRLRRDKRFEKVQGSLVEDPRLYQSEAAENVADQNEVRSLINKALDKLAPGRRVLIELAYFQGLSRSQIAAELEMPLGTVKSRIRAAMGELREFLKAGGF